MGMSVCKPEYDRSILSISSSVMKSYGIKSNYNSLEELDRILEKGYKNVVVLVLDCLGKNILENNLEKNSILRENVVTFVTSVFPPTTAAATTAIHTGLSPYENGWVGWMPYILECNRMIELFSGKDFYTGENVIELPEKGILKYKTIYEDISDKKKDIKYSKVFPSFDKNKDSFTDICNRIKDICKSDEKNLVSAYWTEPDHTIHHNGVCSDVVRNVLGDIDNELRNLVNEIDDTVIIITADHGAVNVEEVYLNEIKEIDECLKMPPSIESRFVSFFIKEGMRDKFVKEMNDHFGGRYILYTKEEFLNEGLLGRGVEHTRIDGYLGDYILISNSDLNIRYSVTGERGHAHIADHGGITEDEMIVPLIVIECLK